MRRIIIEQNEHGVYHIKPSPIISQAFIEQYSLVEPTLDEVEQMSSVQLSAYPEVYIEGTKGSIRFLDPIDLRDLNLAESISIFEFGIDLRIAATALVGIMIDHPPEKLHEQCRQMGVTFLAYNCGTVTFELYHPGTYKFNTSSESSAQ